MNVFIVKIKLYSRSEISHCINLTQKPFDFFFIFAFVTLLSLPHSTPKLINSMSFTHLTLKREVSHWTKRGFWGGESGSEGENQGSSKGLNDFFKDVFMDFSVAR